MNNFYKNMIIHIIKNIDDFDILKSVYSFVKTLIE